MLGTGNTRPLSRWPQVSRLHAWGLAIVVQTADRELRTHAEQCVISYLTLAFTHWHHVKAEQEACPVSGYTEMMQICKII